MNISLSNIPNSLNSSEQRRRLHRLNLEKGHQKGKGVSGILKTGTALKTLVISNTIDAIHNDPFFMTNQAKDGRLSKETVRRFLYPELPDLKRTFDKNTWV